MGEGDQSPARDKQGSNHDLTRREALVVGGVAAGIAVAPRLALAAGRAPAAPGPPPGPALDLGLTTSPSLAFQVIRPADMLYLGFEFYNAKGEVKNGQTYIVPTDPATPTYMVVVFPSQHHGEECYSNQNGDFGYPMPPLHDALAGFSWLTFLVPSHAEIPFTAAGLLDWTGLAPQVYDSPHLPDAMHSALEVPWSLWLSPGKGTWHHSPAPVTSGGRTELWHTRLGLGGFEPPAVTPPIRAFWSFTYGDVLSAPPQDPWLMWPGPDQGPLVRDDIVALTCEVVSGGGPVQTNFLALSALGASINVQGNWSPGPNSGISLIQWIHRASIGRDSYVRVVLLGYLFPFGNRAVYITITDREFQADNAGATVAYLVQRYYVVVTEPVITFTGDPNEPSGGRGNPMRTVEVKTITTPPLDFDSKAFIPEYDVNPSVNYGVDQAFWPRSNGADILFSFVATDIEGRTVDFTTPVIWVDESITDPKDLSNIKVAYDTAGASRNTPSFNGALFAFADPGSTPGSTAHHVETYTLTGQTATNGAANFYPALNTVTGASVHLPGPEQLTGGSLAPPSVTIDGTYLHSGFVAGVTEVYLDIVSGTGPNLSFPVSLVGGMAAPNFGISGLARDLGPVGGDLSTLLGGTFDPSSFFSVLSGGTVGKLLGAIDIIEIVASGLGAAATLAGGVAVPRDIDGTPDINQQAPQISSNWVYPGNDDTKPPTALATKLTWNPKVQADQPFEFFLPDSDANLLITAEIYTPIANPAQTTYSIHGELTNFTLVLFGKKGAEFIDIAFTSFTFDAKTGAKPSVKPQISGVTFAGPLSFIQDFEQLLSSLDGPSIDVTSAGIDASYTLALPDVSLGVFSLSNLSLSGDVNIPFDGTPVRVRFALCSQDNPFLLTIWVFGGGGFFALAIGADGIEMIQVSLEFGAAISIDLGVASGGVSIMAGIYFSLASNSAPPPTDVVQLTGFLRADGNLSVLGIITLSMEFYLGLTYTNAGGQASAYGEASVTVSVSVLFFSASVTATYQKTIAGGSDPDFAQAISQADWDVYCEAFA
jgi:hypothetical protein